VCGKAVEDAGKLKVKKREHIFFKETDIMVVVFTRDIGKQKDIKRREIRTSECVTHMFTVPPAVPRII
jgi:hypothetical protein